MALIVHVVGARPQFVKAASVSRALRASSALTEVLVHTGQHFEPSMSTAFFRELGLPEPHYLIPDSSSDSDRSLESMRNGLLEFLGIHKPQAVVVHGDTTSTLAGAQAASTLGIPLAHIEAGLRSGNFDMPEERIRIETDRLSHWLFCPHQEAKDQLKAEGIDSAQGQKVEVVGDVMFDSLQMVLDRQSPRQFLSEPPYALVTLHRNTTLDSRAQLDKMLRALGQWSTEFEAPLKLMLHPRLRLRATEDAEVRSRLRSSPWRLLPPQSYASTIQLVRHSNWVLTDSGGLQKEAVLLGKPVLVLRGETEWGEWVREGRAVLVGNELKSMREAVSHFVRNPPSALDIPTGASKRIAEIFERDLASL